MSQRKRRPLSLVTALATLLTVLVFPTAGAFAADVPVDCSTEDLQVAINAATSGDTLIIADGTTCTGNFDVNRPLTIRAATAAGATLDGGGANTGPVVNVTATGSVTLQNLTIQNGLNVAPGPGAGGGVLVGGAAVVTIVSSTITGNEADQGGGVYNNGTVTITSTDVVANTAADGGGLYNKATMTVNGSATVDGNSASAIAGGGGGIWTDGDLTVSNAAVTGNTAVDSGGGIHNTSGGTVDIIGSDVTGNTAANAGGVLNNGTLNSGSTMTITDSTISTNGATAATGLGGGGVYNFSFSSDTVKADLTITGSTIADNTSANEGAGGIRNADADVTIDDTTISGNTAVDSGGGIRTSGTLVVTNSTISGNSTDSSGGGIALDGDASILQVRGTVINANTAGFEGGGLSVGPGTAADVKTSSVTRNTASAGAGISNGGAMSMTNSTVSANDAGTQGGGFLTSGTLSVFSSTIATNDAVNEGGGVRVIGVPTVTLTGTILWGNTAGSGVDCSGPLDSGGHMLVGSTAAPCAWTGDPTDLAPGSNPLPGPLGFYGAATEHHPLLAGSDAIDASGACGLATDQIGSIRPDGPACDVGAIEGESTAPPIVADEVLLVEPNGRWHIRVPGNPDYTFFYGVPGDIPLFGDWDGDGLDTPGAWRQGPGGGFAYMTNTLPPNGGSAVADFNFYFGNPGDEVFVGDWDGDTVDTLGINRNGHMFLTNTNGSGGLPVPTNYDFFFGIPGDRAFGGDADGDGDDGVFLYRQSSGFVYFTNQTPVGPGAVAPTAANFFFGDPSDSFVSGDWNADGIDSAAIFRGSNTTVYWTNTNGSGGAPAPTAGSYVWGTAGWTPVAGVTGLS